MATKKSTKKSAQHRHVNYHNGVYTLVLIGAACGLLLSAIDSGSLWAYGATFVAIYWAVHFAKRIVTK